MKKRQIIPHPSDSTAALVELTRGYWAIVDAADATKIGLFNWHVVERPDGLRYAKTNHRLVDGRRDAISLHRFVADLAGIIPRPHIDHRDGNGLNCRRHNLRPATQVENMYNTRIRRNNRSGTKGVYWDASSGKWQARIKANGKRLHLGLFHVLDDAVAAIRSARERFHGEFANHGSN